MAAVQPVSNVSACRARRVSKGPRLALLHFDVDETSLIVSMSDLMKLPANQGKELVLNGTICCNVDGEIHVANLIFLTECCLLILPGKVWANTGPAFLKWEIHVVTLGKICILNSPILLLIMQTDFLKYIRKAIIPICNLHPREQPLVSCCRMLTGNYWHIICPHFYVHFYVHLIHVHVLWYLISEMTCTVSTAQALHGEWRKKNLWRGWTCWRRH